MLHELAISIFRDISTDGFAIGLDFNNGQPEKLISEYRSDWVETYMQSGLIAHDPTIFWGQRFCGATDWERATDIIQPGAENIAMKLAADFGLTKGYSFAAVVNGRRAIASVSRKKPLTEAESRTLTAALCTIQASEAPRVIELLSPSLREILFLTAQGMQEKEIAKQQGVSVSRVKKAKSAINIKMGKNSIIASALAASKKGLI